MWGRPVVFALNGKILVLADWKIIDLWDLTIGRVIRTSDEFKLKINYLIFSPDGEVLVFVGGESMKIWDIVGGNGVRNIDLGYLSVDV